MEKTFDSVSEEKRLKVINNGFKEFSNHGFKRSSLNNILTNSQVSKGFFYHYFCDKEDFYNYLITLGVNTIIEKLMNKKLLDETDFISRLQKAAIYKNEVVKKYPDLMNFYTKLYSDVDAIKLKEITEKTAGDFSNKVLVENIDYTLFRDDIPLESSMKIVSRYISQLTTELQGLLPRMTFEEITSYYERELEDLKNTVYKKGE